MMKYNQNYFNERVDGNFYIGTRFYKWIEGDKQPTCIRLIGTKRKNAQKPKRYIFLNDSGIKISMAVEDFMNSDWKVLKNDGFIIITKTVTVDKKSKDIDVIVYVVKEKIYSVCRQSCINLYRAAAHIDDTHPVLGMSSNKDDYVGNFYNMVVLNGIPKEERAIAVYNDDTLESILQTIDTTPYDLALRRIKTRLEAPNDQFPNGASGCSDSFRNLLEQNLFMYDFYKAFDIFYYPNAIINTDIKDVYLDNNIMQEIYLKAGPNKKILNTYRMKYDKTIDLDSFLRDYILVANKNGVYIIGYDAVDIDQN